LIMITRAQLSRRIEQADPVMRLCLGMLVQRLRLATADPRGHRSAMPAPSSSDGVRATLAQEQELLDAIETAAFEPFFQPVVALGAGAVVGYEALARWAHPARGILGPAAFVPLAERTGLIDRIDRQVQHRACLALASGALAAMPGGMPFLTLNLSATAFADPGFVDAMQAMLAESGADARRIKLEITESALIADPDTAARRLAACRALGFGVAIDDFGTGHASLGYLHRFPVDTIKIDRSFVQGVEQDGKRRAILASILDLAARLGLTTIAEGIETQAQRGALLELGCVYGQGFLFGRPGPCDGRLPAAADQR